MAANMHDLKIGGVTLYYSYDTCIAFRAEGVRVRRESDYSAATRRHMYKHGVTNWDKLNDRDFERKMEDTIAADAIERMTERLSRDQRP